MPHPRFDRTKLKLAPLRERRHDMTLDDVLNLDTSVPPFEGKSLEDVANRILSARNDDRPVIVMMGAHVIKVGLSRFLIDLMERGHITHIAANGGTLIHDFELALIGATTESVSHYIQTGEFGLWEETGRINTVAVTAALDQMGLGEAVGREVLRLDLPHADVSIYAAAARLGIPATVHVGMGFDNFHEHPNCDGAAIGETSYTDFLVLAHSVSSLEGGVFLNLGSAVTGPEVFLKALAMCRNVARQEGRSISHFTTGVFDLIELGSDLDAEAPKTDPRYYYRPFKSLLVRCVRGGGESFYVQGDHAHTIPNLYKHLVSGPPSAG